MSNIAYEDEARTRPVDNKYVAKHLEEFKAENHVCYCPNPHCGAHMTPARHKDGVIWRALPTCPHDNECAYGSSIFSEFHAEDYSYSDFWINDFLEGLENPVRTKTPAQQGQNTTGPAREQNKKRPINLAQVYKLCKSLPLSTWFQGRTVRNTIVDDRTVKYRLNDENSKIIGSNIAELKYYGYPRDPEQTEIYAGILGAKDSGLTVTLVFRDKNLFQEVKQRIFAGSPKQAGNTQQADHDQVPDKAPTKNTAHRNKVIVVAGKWHQSVEDPKHYTIYVNHLRQIYIFKRPKNKKSQHQEVDQ